MRYTTEEHAVRLDGARLTQEHEDGWELVSETSHVNPLTGFVRWAYVFREIAR